MADVEMATGSAAAAPSDPTNSAVATKYTDAAAIANAVLQEVLAALAAGKSIVELCELGDSRIEAELAKVYKKAKVEKGIAFPTCISVNECVGHYSPLKSESKTLADGDVVKVDLGVHIDGFMALVAHTTVLGAGAAVTGAKADVIAAAHEAAEVALRLIKPGNKNTQVTEAIEKVAAAYGVNPIMTMQCSEVKQWLIEADKAIPMKRDPEIKYTECDFKLGEVYAVDIAMSSGDGKPREGEGARTTVYKKNIEVQYNMRMGASQKLMSEVNRRFPALPFSLRAFPDEKIAKLGVVEPSKHGALQAYPVLFEKEGVVVAHTRFTALVLPAGTLRITGLELPASIKSDKALPSDLAALRAQPSYVKPAKKDKDVAMGQ